jgi:hypothetical protein
MGSKARQEGASSGPVRALENLSPREIAYLRRRRLLDLIGSGTKLVDAAATISDEFGVKRNTIYQDWTRRKDWIADIVQASPLDLEDYFAQAFGRLEHLREEAGQLRQAAMRRLTTVMQNAEVREPRVVKVDGKDKVVYDVRKGQKPLEIEDPDYRAAIAALDKQIQVEELALRIGVVFLDASQPRDGQPGNPAFPGPGLPPEKREAMLKSAYAFLHNRIGKPAGAGATGVDIELYTERSSLPELLPSEVMKSGGGSTMAERRDTLEEVLRDG